MPHRRTRPEFVAQWPLETTVGGLVEAFGRDAQAAVAAIRRARAAHGPGSGTPLPGLDGGGDDGRYGCRARRRALGEGRRHRDLQPRFRVQPMLTFVDHGGGGTGEPLAASFARQGQCRRRPAIGSRCSMSLLPTADRCAFGSGAWSYRLRGQGIRLARPRSRAAVLAGSVSPSSVFDTLGARRSSRRDTPSTPTAQPHDGAPGRQADPVDPVDLHRVAAGMRSSPAGNAPIRARDYASPTTRMASHRLCGRRRR